jgi:hypothetical protein
MSSHQILRRSLTCVLLMAPWATLRAQGICSASGMTLDEALAAWQDAKKQAQMDKDAYNVTIDRKYMAVFKGKKGNADVEELGVVGELRINGKLIGEVIENDAVKIKAGSYKGVMRYGSNKNFVQGPLGVMAEKGDFLLEVSRVAGRTNLLIHTGTKPWHSEGCVLAGAAVKKNVDGKTIVLIQEGTTLREMRKAFYGTDAEPNACPNKTVKVQIKDI